MSSFNFEPKKAEVFQYAQFVYEYNRWPILIIRVLLAITFIVALGFWSLSWEQSPNKLALFLVSFTSLFIMFELFYHLKFTKTTFYLTIPREKDESLNLAKVVDLEAATLILKSHNDPYRLLTNLLESKIGQFILLRADLNPVAINKQIQILSKKEAEYFPVAQVVEEGLKSAQSLDHPYINSSDLLVSYFVIFPTLRNLLFEAESKIEDLINIVYWQEKEIEGSKKSFFDTSPTLGFASSWAAGYTLTLESMATDLNLHLQTSSRDSSFIGREQELANLETVLSRSSKRNVILVGEPGVGKTTLIHGLILRALEGKSTGLISFKRFFELNVTALLAGVVSQGDLEQRLKLILEEMAGSDVILVIPQLQNLTGSTGNSGLDISGLLEPYLKEGNLQLIATSNKVQFRRDIEPKSGFLENFEIIHIDEPKKEDVIRIMERGAPFYERRYGMLITYKALLKIIEVGDKVDPDRLFPGKAISLLDEILAFYAGKGHPRLEPQDVIDFLQTKTKIPLRAASETESKKLLNLEKELASRVIGQKLALHDLALAIQRSRTLIKDPDKPIGVFLFLGPTGVGKTETAKSLAALYFGSEAEMVRLDMSEYQDQYSMEKLIGTPGNPEEGLLTTKIHENPYCLVLLDELEKAHPKVLDLFLQVFDDGRLTDGSGRTVKFNNTIIIATSNAGSEIIREKIGNLTDINNLKPQLLDFLQRQSLFKPEFLNRFDDIIIYQPLTITQIQEVTELQVKYLIERLKSRDIGLKISPRAIALLAELGYDPVYGARALRRIIQEKIENPIATLILQKNLKRGAIISIDTGDQKEITLLST